jgi:7,8-dihydro-6-hydroxymethylpterin-pyrophosphokinase
LTPQQLRAFVKDIEAAMGREPAPRWAARVIDIDVLLYGDAVVRDDDLVIPHPSMLERHFVMVPLAEIAPGAVHPVSGQTIGELAEDVDVAGLAYVEGPEWASGAAARAG